MGVISFMLLLPLVAACCTFLARHHAELCKVIALIASGIVLLMSFYLWYAFDPAASGYQFEVLLKWFPSLGVSYGVGIDGLALPFVILTSLLCFLALIYTNDIPERASLYYALVLLVEVGLIGVFTATDLFLFYIFWEVVLLPMFFMIGIWGGNFRSYAAMKFLIYTHVASVIMMLAIGAMYFKAESLLGYYTFYIPDLISAGFPADFQMLVFPALLFAFAVKLATVPFHTWLPDAYVEAPIGGTILLSGIIIKMGGYGLIRVGYMMNPAGAEHYTTLIVVLALITIVFGAFVALTQDSLRKLLAYSSISHMGFILIGVASLTYFGVRGAVFQMVAHGLIFAALFMACGVIEERAKTDLISKIGGLYYKIPKTMTLLLLACLASMGIPGFAGFVGEFAVLAGVVDAFGWLVLLIILGMVISVAFYLWMFQRIAFGQVSENLVNIKDCSLFEGAPIVVLVVLFILFGLMPTPIFDMFETQVAFLLSLI
jgi:proton-translocating NADH-quinone oxidoreductase chain M